MLYPRQESSTLELKREYDQIVKTIIGCCNQNGGKLVIGVSDDGRVAGLSKNQIDHLLEPLEQTIYQSSMPPIIPMVYPQTLGDKTIVASARGLREILLASARRGRPRTYGEPFRMTNPPEADQEQTFAPPNGKHVRVRRWHDLLTRGAGQHPFDVVSAEVFAGTRSVYGKPIWPMVAEEQRNALSPYSAL